MGPRVCVFSSRTDGSIVESEETAAETDGASQAHGPCKTVAAHQGGLHYLESEQQTGACGAGNGAGGVVGRSCIADDSLEVSVERSMGGVTRGRRQRACRGVRVIVDELRAAKKVSMGRAWRGGSHARGTWS